MRVSELIKLELGDLDLNHGYVKSMGKGQKERLVPLNERALSLLCAYLDLGRRRFLNNKISSWVFIRKNAFNLLKCLEDYQEIREPSRIKY